MTVFFISDTHFGHRNVIHFTKEDGVTLLRTFLDSNGNWRGFLSIEEMDEHIVDNWNKTVSPQDKVYHLGDFSLGKNPSIAGRLNGHKRLVRGNHDNNKIKEYAKYFEEIYGIRHLQGCALSHVPIHPQSLKRWGLNIHGHLHGAVILKDGKPDPDYFNVSVERINYTPISVDEIMKQTGRKLL